MKTPTKIVVLGIVAAVVAGVGLLYWRGRKATAVAAGTDPQATGEPTTGATVVAGWRDVVASRGGGNTGTAPTREQADQHTPTKPTTTLDREAAVIGNRLNPPDKVALAKVGIR